MAWKWASHMREACHPEVQHLVFFVNEQIPGWRLLLPDNFWFVMAPCHPRTSIGHHHNRGASISESAWVLKLDIDTVAHQDYWNALLPILKTAGEREWFNCGMGYLKHQPSESLAPGITGADVLRLLQSPRSHFDNWKGCPSGTNFVAPRLAYLEHAQCDARFRGYGWEDYQQLHALERWQLGKDPLEGCQITAKNVTQLCRDRIGIRKSRELWLRDNRLCLLHHWHPVARGTPYRDRRQMDANRAVLFEHCQNARL